MATLTGTQIRNTNDALLKLEDNDGVNGTKKQIQDGLGTATPLSISTSEVTSTVAIEATGFKTPTGLSTEFLKADGSVSSGSSGGGTVSGTGTDNTIAMFNGTGDIQDSALFQDSNGNIGIGTSNPLAKLDIEGMSTTVPSLKVNAVSGDNLIMDIYNSSNVKRMGFEYDNSNINFNITDRNTNKLLTVRESGNVGIGDDTPSFKLDVAGAIRATGDITAFSDERVKEDVNTIENASEKVSKLRGVSYKKIGEGNLRIGVIAQEIEKVMPEVVYTDPKGMKSVAYANLVGLLIESNKELQKRIEILEAK